MAASLKEPAIALVAQLRPWVEVARDGIGCGIMICKTVLVYCYKTVHKNSMQQCSMQDLHLDLAP